jgi:superfamily II DNA or RNA helicase
MALSRLLASHFSRPVQARGRNYFATGVVKIDETGPRHTSATVRGSEIYKVELDLRNNTLHAHCSCPFANQYLEPCKHIWATVLKTEAQHSMNEVGRHGRVRFKLDVDDTNGVDDEYVGSRAPGANPTQPRGKRRRRRRSPSWKERFASVREDDLENGMLGTFPASRALLYVVDVPGSLARGGLSLDIMSRDRKKNGEWNRPRVQTILANQLANLPDANDRRILATLFGAGLVNTFGHYGALGHGCNRFALNNPLLEEVLPSIGATGRLAVRVTAPRGEPIGVTWDDGPAWTFAVEVVLADSGKQYVLTAALRRGEERRSLSSALLLIPGAVVWPDRVARLDDQGALPWIRMLRTEGPFLIPLRDKDKLIMELLALPHLPRLELPEELRFEEVSLPVRPRLVVKPSTAGWRRDLLEAELSFVYGETTVAAHPRQRGIYEAKSRRLLTRDLPAEQVAEEQLAQLGLSKRSEYASRSEDFELSARHLGKTVRSLVEQGWRVEAEGNLYRKPGEFKLKLASGIDWFDVEAAVDFEGKSVSLPSLLEALRRGEHTVQLDDGSLGMLPEEWLKKYGLLARMGKVEHDKVRFSRAQIGLLDAMLADQPAASLDQTFIKARDELRRFAGVEPAEPPAEFVGLLRHYQCEGLGWLQFLQHFGFGGCLADDMGLGKTIQVLALLAGRRAAHNGQPRPGPALVVVPRSLVFNWKSEAARFAPQLKILDHTGLGRSKSSEVFEQYDLVLTTYGTLRRDVLLLKEYTFDYCILDESQAIKNADSEAAKSARLLKSHHRLALSGTPVENHLGELWSLFEFLNPGMLGQASVFQQGVGARNPDQESRTLLARALRPFILRRTKDQVAPELPPKTEQTLFCDLEPAQRKLYDELREHYRLALLGRLDADILRRSKIQVLEALLRLRQAACHPGLIDKSRTEEASAKLDMLLPHLREVVDEGHKALVFSQFTSLLAIVRARLDAEGLPYEYLDGRTRDRAARVERFQNDAECKLFLVSLKAGGVGLNLTAAEYVYLLDPWWNPAVEAQAIDRTHRIGQERPVFAYRLIARDTVEEKVLELQQSKRALADAIIGADNSLIRDLKREDLELLLS